MFFLRRSELRWLVSELRPWMVGARVQKVRRLHTGCLILHCHRPGQALDLVISTNPHISRLTMSTEKTPSVSADDHSAQWLKSNLRGHRIQDVSFDEHDKVVEIYWPNGRLVMELFGTQPRLIGLDCDQTIRCVDPTQSGERLRLGGGYQKVTHSRASAALDQDEVRFTTVAEVERAALSMYESIVKSRGELEKRKLMKRSQKQIERLKRKLEGDLKKLGAPEQWQRKGELVKSQVWQLKKGQTSVEVVDYFDSEMPTIKIELNPKYTGAENRAQFIFSVESRRLTSG